MEERTFYDMTGAKNIFSYITRKDKLLETANALDYLQKSTGVFNHNGNLEKDEVDKMKARVKKNKSNIWHGFISLNEENSPKINTPEKCIALIKSTFKSFFKEAHIPEKNIDLMCSLHLDRPKHLHIHFIFWEKEPMYKDSKGGLKYRSKGVIDKIAIDNMFVRSGMFVSGGKEKLYKTRDSAISELRGMTAVNVIMTGNDEIKKEIISLAKSLSKTGRLSYGSSDMESYRGRVDKIVKMLLDSNGKARIADKRFYLALAAKERTIKNICGKPYAFSDKNVSNEDMAKDFVGSDSEKKYHYNIDYKNIKIIAEIEADYKRRQGNLVLSLAKFIKPEFYDSKKKRYKVNDKNLKRSKGIADKKVNRLFEQFISSLGRESELLERSYINRIREIEDEIKRERESENGAEGFSKEE